MTISRPPLLLATLSLFASGGAGLACQIAWQRYFGRLVGTDAVATATTLAVFLSGLSLGYALCGRWSARVRSPLGVYIVLEALIGIWGLLFHRLFELVERAADGVALSTPLTLTLGSLAAAIVLILPPTLLMGATVPFMTRVLLTPDRRAAGTLAWVYGVNTAGAVAGALGAAFVLMPRLGPPATMMTAAGLNFLAAAMLLTLRLRTGSVADSPPVEPAARADRRAPLWLCVLAVLSGFLVMNQEAALIRFASLVFGGTGYVFALIVATFVLGIALGSLAVSRLKSIPPTAVGGVCSFAALLWLAVFLTLDRWPYWAHLIRIAVQGNVAGFFFYYALIFSFLMLLLIPCIAPLGAVLPLLFHEHGTEGRSAGRSAGGLLAWNALGALLGSLGGGVLLFYILDLGRIILVGPFVAAVMALIALRWQSSRWRPAAACLVVLSAGVLILRPGFDPSRVAMGTYRLRQPEPASFRGAQAFHEERFVSRRLVSLEDSPLATVAVFEAPVLAIPGLSPLSLFINGKSDSNTAADRFTLRLSAHIPALASPAARSALVVGLGTGVTAGELSLYPGLETLDVAEISPAVVRALPEFARATHGVHEDPRLRVHTRDARLMLRGGGRRWDLIVSEPSNVWVAGMDLLFTREFMESARESLEPGGLFLQWVQLYEADCEMIYIILGTLRGAFTHMRAFHGSQGDLLIVASPDPIAMPVETIEARLAEHPEVARSLNEIGIDSARDLLDREVTILPMILDRAAPYAPHTLAGSRLPYLAGLGVFRGGTVQVPDLAGLGTGGGCGDGVDGASEE